MVPWRGGKGYKATEEKIKKDEVVGYDDYFFGESEKKLD